MDRYLRVPLSDARRLAYPRSCVLISIFVLPTSKKPTSEEPTS